MKTTRGLQILFIFLAVLGVIKVVQDSIAEVERTTLDPVCYLETLRVGEKEVFLDEYGPESFCSNEESGTITAKAKEGWEIIEVKYYPENDLNIKGQASDRGTEIIYNNAYLLEEEQLQTIEMNTPVAYGDCYTHFYVYMKNLENGIIAREHVTVFAYDELIIDWGEMRDGETSFVFNLNYLEGDTLKNDDWIMTYKKKASENSIAEFNSKEEFIDDMYLYFLDCGFGEQYTYENSGQRIVVKVQKDFGLKGVQVKNEGEGTAIQLVRL